MTHFINKIWQKWCPGLTICYCSVTQSSLTLCDPMDCSMPGFPILHHLPELAKTYAHWVGDIIRPSHPLSPSPPAFNLSHLQGLFYWVSSLHEVAKVLEHQHQSFQWVIQNWFPLGLMVGSPCSPRDSQESFSTPQFKSINSLVFSFLYGPTLTHTLTTGKTITFDYIDLCQ